MTDLRETDAIWADEGGVRLELSRAPNGGVRFRFESPTGEWHADATIAQFRLKRIADFIAPSIEAEQALYKVHPTDAVAQALRMPIHDFR